MDLAAGGGGAGGTSEGGKKVKPSNTTIKDLPGDERYADKFLGFLERAKDGEVKEGSLTVETVPFILSFFAFFVPFSFPFLF